MRSDGRWGDALVDQRGQLRGGAVIIARIDVIQGRFQTRRILFNRLRRSHFQILVQRDTADQRRPGKVGQNAIAFPKNRQAILT